MSCRFAGCPGPAAFWNAILDRRVMLTPPGPEAELPVGRKNFFDRPYPQRIGQLGDLFSCVPAMQNFPRLGYAPPFNASTVNWLQHTSFLDQTMEVIRRFFPSAPEEAMDSVKAKLVESLPLPDAASFLLGTGYRFVSWIARECSFAGSATIMDAGMLSGAATIADAMDDLASGRADVALAGALTPPLSRAYIEGLSGEIDFSRRTELTPFSRDPDGTLPGEGGAFFVLKRRSDALRDRDRIYALVRSVALGHCPDDDPSALLREATEGAGIPPRSRALPLSCSGSSRKGRTSPCPRPLASPSRTPRRPSRSSCPWQSPRTPQGRSP